MGFELIIFAAEGDDTEVALLAGELADAIAMEAGAVDNPIGGEIAGGGFDGPFAALVKTGGAGVGDDFSAHFFDIFDQCGDYGLVIDYAFLRHFQRRLAADVRLNFAHLVAG